MLNIILENLKIDIILKIKYIFIKFKIKCYINTKLINNNYPCIFIKDFISPIIDFEIELTKIINNLTISFCYLSTCKKIYFSRNIDFNIENIINPLFYSENINSIDHIIVPAEITKEYIILLKKFNINYDYCINNHISYKSYKLFLEYQVTSNYCFNFIIFITTINQLYEIKLPTYKYYRITIFHKLKNEDDIRLLNSFCLNNKIICYVYLFYWAWFFNFVSKRLLWFEKIILIKNINLLSSYTIEELNKYHKVKENILFDNIISISAHNWILIPYFIFQKDIVLSIKTIFNLVKEYIFINFISNNYLSKLDKEFIKNQKKINFVIKNSFSYSQNQLLKIRNYPLLIDSINAEIKENYNGQKYISLLEKKVSISILCKSENDILIDATKIISKINDIEILNNLVILFSNIQNQQIINKLYIKVLTLANENKINNISLLCFQRLLTLNLDEEAITTILNFIDILKHNNILKEDQFKKILISLFYNISKFVEKPEIIERFNKLILDSFNTTDILKIELNDKNKIFLLHFIITISTSFSAYYNTYDEFLNKRNEIKNNIINNLEKELPTCSLDEILLLPVNNFYLSYQGISSKDIFELKSTLLRKICPELNYSACLNFNSAKINICFHSNFLTRQHSVFKDRSLIIKGLSIDYRFNVYFSTFDDLTDDVRFLFGNAKHIKLDSKLSQIKVQLENLKLDVLVYCEIGMDSRAYYMAHMKLAKIQINTWGHSDTSGIKTIDYYFSSKLYELPLEEAQENYSEKLILLNSLCTCYYNPVNRYNIQTFKSRYDFGFTDDVIIYFCAQSLFKFNPLFDEYLINILQANTNFILIILNNDAKAQVLKRFNYKNIVARIHIFPMVSHNIFLNLIQISDIILDPYPFGGCNTSLEAFSLNKVCITQQTNIINGRFTSGFYKKMELEELITKTKEEYIELSIKLGTNLSLRNKFENKILLKKNILFNDTASIIEWGDTIYNFLKN